jgi:1-acyl-sn-glycerol-3-phosphate acyltransferase
VTDEGVNEEDPVFRVARHASRAASAWHRARLTGAEHLPQGPVLLVGNHGLFGLETPIFFSLLHRATGRIPVGLADRVLFGVKPVRELLRRIGSVVGTRENALEVLKRGRLVVCYPGGSREVFKPQDASYRLRWTRSLGFGRLAIDTQVPVVPFAGLGVDESFLHFGHPAALTRLLGRYTPPLALGIGLVPFPVRFRFRLGEPLTPPRTQAALGDFCQRVQHHVEDLLEEDGAPEAQPAPLVH